MVTGVPVDTDRDGMPDDWELLHGMDPTSALGDDGPDADSDHDGLSNYGEYLAGTDPHDPNSVLRVTATLLPGNKVRLSWKMAPGHHYEILYADSFDYVFRVIPGAGFPRVATSTEEQFEDTLPSGASGARFYRLRLSP
jgi:hypothetical protein